MRGPYVLNVFEDATERAQVLQAAWALCQKLLVVAARILVDGRGTSQLEYADGVLTRLGTFQKYFSQSGLQEYIEQNLCTDAVPAAPGVFYVFRDRAFGEQFSLRRYRRSTAAPRRRESEVRFEQHREILEPLIARMTELSTGQK